MEKGKKITIVLIIASVIFLISGIIYLRFELKGKIYLNVNEDNIETIRELCEIGDIEIDNGLSQIGYKMFLGDWELYLKYQNGTSDWALLNDTVGVDLRTYIQENGKMGGIAGTITYKIMNGSAVLVLICVIYFVISKICSDNFRNMIHRKEIYSYKGCKI